MARRILIASFGSAGDLFPLVPAIQCLRQRGHDVRCAVPRALGLYLRALGLPADAVGDGSEMRVLDDPEIVTTRFDGWASWRLTFTRYVAPRLARDVERIGHVIDTWRPDVVAATSFAVAARLAATVRAVPLLGLSIYPQHQHEPSRNTGFGLPLRSLVAEASGLDVRHETVTSIVWGTGPGGVLLHDPVLMGETSSGAGEAIGFPSWDNAPARPGELEQIDAWLAASQQPTVLVTLGSFLGARQGAVWLDAVRASEALRARVLLVGPRSGGEDDALVAGHPGVLRTGFVPLSLVAPRVDAVVHHGGIGTTFAALRAGRPAAVVPLAFDQPHNARLIERAGVGVDAARRGLLPALERVLADTMMATRATDTATRLVPPEVAVRRAVDCIETAGRGQAVQR